MKGILLCGRSVGGEFFFGIDFSRGGFAARVLARCGEVLSLGMVLFVWWLTFELWRKSLG